MKQINRREVMAAMTTALVIPGAAMAISSNAAATNPRDEEAEQWVKELFERQAEHQRKAKPEEMKMLTFATAEKAHQKGYPVLALIFNLMATIWMNNKNPANGFMGFDSIIRGVLEEFVKNPR